MNDERMKVLADYLSTDTDRTEKLFEMGAEAAQKEINADGFDFTVDEIKTFAQEVVNVGQTANRELDAEDLDNVNGGVAFSALCGAFLWCYGTKKACDLALKWLNR